MHIVIGVDRSAAAEVACRFVAGRSWPIGTRITLVSAFEPTIDWSGMAPPATQGIVAERDALVALLEERAAPLRTGGWVVETVVDNGPAADLLIAQAEAVMADLIVVGSRGLGPIGRAVIGSVSTHLADHAPCPVLVARSPEATRMLLATDGTTSSRNIPRVLAAWGSALRGLPTEVVCVAPREVPVMAWASESGDGIGERDLAIHEGIAEQVADEMVELGWTAAAIVRAGDPGREIVAAGQDWGVDLIVTGSRGLGTLRRLVVGSVAHDVVLHTRSSVLVVRGLVPARRGHLALAQAAMA